MIYLTCDPAFIALEWSAAADAEQRHRYPELYQLGPREYVPVLAPRWQASWELGVVDVDPHGEGFEVPELKRGRCSHASGFLGSFLVFVDDAALQVVLPFLGSEDERLPARYEGKQVSVVHIRKVRPAQQIGPREIAKERPTGLRLLAGEEVKTAFEQADLGGVRFRPPRKRAAV